MRKFVLYFCIVVSLAGFGVVHSQDEKASGVKPIPVAKEDAERLSTLYQQQARARIALEEATALFLNKESACEQSTLRALQLNHVAKAGVYQNAILNLKVSLDVPKAFEFNQESGSFVPPKKP